MKLFVFCLFAVYCYSVANASTNGSNMLVVRKLKEVLRQLNAVKGTLQIKEQMLLNTPETIEDCCCLSALECFRANLNTKFNVTEAKTSKLYRSLKNPLTMRGLDFCDSGNSQTTCQVCDAHPKVNATAFFDRLGTLIQEGIMRLSKK